MDEIRSKRLKTRSRLYRSWRRRSGKEREGTMGRGSYTYAIGRGGGVSEIIMVPVPYIPEICRIKYL